MTQESPNKGAAPAHLLRLPEVAPPVELRKKLLRNGGPQLQAHCLQIARLDVVEERPSKVAAPDRLLRLPEVESIVGLRKSSIYDAMRRGEFPAAVKLSRRAVCWSESSVREWVQDRINEARASQAGEVQP